MTADPFDYPDDPAPAFGDPILPPEPTWTPPDHDDDETAFWRDVRNPHAPTPTDDEPAPVGTPYAEFIAAERRAALTVPCPACKVDIGVPCVIVGTTQPLRKFPAHTVRTNNARKATR